MAERTTKIDDEVEIGRPQDILDRIDEFWFEELSIGKDDHVYVRKVNKHLVIGKAKIEFIE
jgi:hypothetical protein